MSEFLDIAKQVVREAGTLALQCQPREVYRYKANREIVTWGDVQVEEYVISALRRRFPDHGFDSEERGTEGAEAEYVWILDPIDGTRYYVGGIPLYAVSLALRHRQELILGIVYGPELGQTYVALSGHGATMNDRRITCSSKSRIEEISVCLEIPSRDSPPEQLPWAMEKMVTLVRHTRRVRILGVGSLGLCFCAAGGFDVYVNLGSATKLCDVAAGHVMVEEAGGQFLSLGEGNSPIIAGPESLCSQIRELLGL